MIWDHWPERWQAARQACERLGGDPLTMDVQGPATEAEVAAVQQELGIALPVSLRQVLTGFSRAVDFSWFLPEGTRFPEPFHEIFSGECSWDLGSLVELERTRRRWIEGVFPDPEDRYDRVWLRKLAFLEVANGDLLALDLAEPEAPVVYLSHDDGNGHGYRLGRDFADFIERWTTLGCPGAEDWQMLPFLPTPDGGLDISGENAAAWRALLGLPQWEPPSGVRAETGGDL
jgi:hypothetical protein